MMFWRKSETGAHALKRRRVPRASCVALAGVLAVAGCAGGEGGEGTNIADNFSLSDPQGTLRLAVGSKDFTEQEVLGEITIQALEAAGAEVIDKTGLGSTEEVRLALASGSIDMYWEYTGTGWLVHLAEPESIADSEELYEAVRAEDAEQNGIEWLAPAPANNTYAIAVREDAGEGIDLENISELRSLIEESPEKATLCVGPEFSSRADGLPGLERAYGFEFPADQVFVVSESTVYGAVSKGAKCNFGSVYQTNGRIPELGLNLLNDDETFFAAYNPALTMRQATLDSYPELKEIFAPITELLDTEALRDLSSAVDVEGNSPATVAERWLRDNGFVS